MSQISLKKLFAIGVCAGAALYGAYYVYSSKSSSKDKSASVSPPKTEPSKTDAPKAAAAAEQPAKPQPPQPAKAAEPVAPEPIKPAEPAEPAPVAFGFTLNVIPPEEEKGSPPAQPAKRLAFLDESPIPEELRIDRDILHASKFIGTVSEEKSKPTLPADVVRCLTEAFAHSLRRSSAKSFDGLKISVGTDTRNSGAALKKEVISKLSILGVQTFDLGIATPSAMYLSTVTENYAYDGAILITGSDRGPNINGLYFLTKSGPLGTKDCREIMAHAQSIRAPDTSVRKSSRSESKGSSPKSVTAGESKSVNFVQDVYLPSLVKQAVSLSAVHKPKSAEKPFAGLRVIVDASNGVAGLFVTHVLANLGADTTGSLNLEQNGNFPGHLPSAGNQDAVAAVQAAVKKANADVGFLFDGDGTRVSVIANDGRHLRSEKFVALISALLLGDNQGGTVFTVSPVCDAVSEFIQKLGGKHQRVSRDYRRVARAAKKIDTPAVSVSRCGNVGYKEYLFVEDGLAAAVRVLAKIVGLKAANKETLTSLLSSVVDSVDSVKWNFDCTAKEFQTHSTAVLEDLRAWVPTNKGWSISSEQDNDVHITVNKATGDFILFGVNEEAESFSVQISSGQEHGVAPIAATFATFLKKTPKLNLAPLEEYLKK